MARVQITDTPISITGSFNLQVQGNPSNPSQADAKTFLELALGSGVTDPAQFETVKVFAGKGHHYVANAGTNTYKLASVIPGVTVWYNNS
jgi:hypothetical protein